MNPEPSAAGPNPIAPSEDSQAASGTSERTHDIVNQEHEKPHVLPRKPNPFKSANGVGAAISLEPSDLSIADDERSTPDGPRTEREGGGKAVHLLLRQETRRVEGARNGPIIESGRIAPVIERDRLNSIDQLPAVPSSPHTVRNTGTSFQGLTPRDRLFQVIGRVRWQIRVSLDLV